MTTGNPTNGHDLSDWVPASHDLLPGADQAVIG